MQADRATLLAQYDGKKQTTWMPVSEGLPPHGGQVLITWSIGGINRFVGQARYEGGRWDWGTNLANSPCQDHEVLAWMDRLEPYEPPVVQPSAEQDADRKYLASYLRHGAISDSDKYRRMTREEFVSAGNPRLSTLAGEVYDQYHKAETKPVDPQVALAAPELLEAVQNFLGLYDNPIERRGYGPESMYTTTVAQAREALRKAGKPRESSNG